MTRRPSIFDLEPEEGPPPAPKRTEEERRAAGLAAISGFLRSARKKARREGTTLDYGLDEDVPPESPEQMELRESKAESRRASNRRHDALQRKIILAIRHAGHRAQRVDSRARKIHTRNGPIYARAMAAGKLDITGSLVPSGRGFDLEVKTGTGRLTPEQEEFIRQAQADGRIAAEVSSVEDALAALGL